MTTPTKPAKRPYLSREDRRLSLLDVAGDIVEQEGWGGLTMISLAEKARVSRQLVYQHFASVNELMAETMAHLFRHRYEHIRRSIANPEMNLGELVRIADRQTFDEPPERVRALWQMMSLTDHDNAEVAQLSRRLRHLIMKLWAPVIEDVSELDQTQSRAMSWMINMAFWGAHQLVEEGEMSRKAATELCAWLMERLPARPPEAR